MRTQRSIFVVLLALIILLAVACAPQGQPATDASQPSAGEPSTDASPAPGPKELHVGVQVEPRDLDPQNFSASVSHSIVLHVHNTLFELNKDLEPVPSLAESAEVSDDGLTWTIKLKEGIQFHDGTPFTADAVKAIVDKTLGDNPPIRSSFIGRNDLESATVIDDHTVEIKTKQPVGPFLYMLAGPAWAINSPAAYEKYGEDATKNPVGTGPYLGTGKIRA